MQAELKSVYKFACLTGGYFGLVLDGTKVPFWSQAFFFAQQPKQSIGLVMLLIKPKNAAETVIDNTATKLPSVVITSKRKSK